MSRFRVPRGTKIPVYPNLDKRKKQWINEAIQILKRQGYENPTVRQIANLLGVSHETVRKWGELVNSVDKSSEKIGDSPKTKLKGTVYNVWGFTIKRYRKELEAAGELEPITERLTSDGSIYSVSQVSRGISEISEMGPYPSCFRFFRILASSLYLANFVHTSL
ncbi:hypothetical protein DRP04_04140 [Archaeoglobales archaeon]|nr:MAG: hypothetical protein DRP04_04140 [Archaeoglobales archaeon]